MFVASKWSPLARADISGAFLLSNRQNWSLAGPSCQGLEIAGAAIGLTIP